MGKITVDELSKSMGRVIPTASANNVEMEQLSAAYAHLTKNGIPARQTTTMIAAVLDELGKTGSTTDEILREKTGKAFRELSAEGWSLTDVLAVVDEHAKENDLTMKDLFSSTVAGSGALALFSGEGAEFSEILEQMNSVGGETQANFETISDTAQLDG